VNRRTFFQITSVAAMAGASRAADPIPIIDTHIHLFDPTRPEGVPWPPKDNAVLYKPALPDRLRKIAGPLGVVGAIKVEASPWIGDNQWVLDVIEKDPFMVGMVGNLEPGKPDFRAHLDRLHKNKLFLGIRYGNLWGRDLAADLANPDFVAGLKALAAAGLELDSAGPNPDLLKAILRVNDLVPDLRIVVDHLPQMNPPTEAPAQRELDATLREIAKRPRIYFKVSEVYRRVDGKIPTDLDFYRPRIDQMWDLFGEDRLLYGSDWPNSDNWKPYPEVLRLVQEYFAAKGRTAAEKFFWKNSISAYRWVKRDASQPAT
jgi:predicted TIM-barrel fold metal-dependent hydrolase